VQQLPHPPASPWDTEPEALLWERGRAGDGEAFGVLFDRHRERVFRHACRLAATRPDAEDVLASAFLELWRLRERVRLVDGSVLPWLLAATTNVGLNAARSRRRYQRFLARLPHGAEQPDVADTAGGWQIDPLLREAMRSLRVKDAQLIVLVALEGYPVGDAAACLRLTPEAARARLHRARRQLRQHLVQEPSPGLRIAEEGS
jgi:RNA polymerase sigma-70 factor (ECF subfamily)